MYHLALRRRSFVASTSPFDVSSTAYLYSPLRPNLLTVNVALSVADTHLLDETLFMTVPFVTDSRLNACDR